MAVTMLVTFAILRLVLIALSFGDAGARTLEAYLFGVLQDVQIISVLLVLAFVFSGIGTVFRWCYHKIRKVQGADKAVETSPAVWPAAIWWFIFIFICFSEIFFWREFETRFNFIAVDYLVYTNEVWENIWQSYPVIWILISIGVIAFVISKWILPTTRTWQKKHFKVLRVVWILALLLSFVPTLSPDTVPGDQFQREVATNGWKSFIQAYFQNEIKYKRFYKTLPEDKVHTLIEKPELAGHMGQMVISANPRPEKLNVMLVVIESLSRRYLTGYGEKKVLTPRFNQLYKEGIAFSNFYATGTRTVRGLEAVFLGVPPTPGQSILRRPGYENLYSLGSYLKHAGYHNQFLYGGYSVFDNMGPFFAANDMEIVDRASLTKDQVTFESAWGACDEDMFNKAISEADKISAEHKPFFQLIMTTSNHRPYTYPNGKVDIPSGSGRDGAVKYTDYAIGHLLDEARKKPWFDNTVFVFVADHNASVAGRIALPVHDFPIPFVMYAPKWLQPKMIDQLGSQIDLAPTVLDVIGMNYRNHFFGKSLLKPVDQRAFISTYQSMGYIKNNILTVLKPKRIVNQYDLKNDKEIERSILDNNLVDEAISYYQHAAALFEDGGMKNTGDDQIELQKPAKASLSTH